MEQLVAWVSTHALDCFVAYLVFMAAVQALPRPTDKSSAFYTWFYQFVHLLAMNLKLVADPRKRLPEEELKADAAPKG